MNATFIALLWMFTGQPVASSTTSWGCDRCHTTESFEVAVFDHKNLTRFPLEGRHQGAQCNDCHHVVSLPNHGEVRLYRIGNTDCSSCHASGHDGLAMRLLQRSARSISDPVRPIGKQQSATREAALAQCSQCHNVTHWRDAQSTEKFDHGLVGYLLRGRHQLTNCQACHKPSQAVSRQCNSCHADVHQGRLGQQCAECHGQSNWQPTRILARHRQTRLPLTGMHALADCTACHPVNRQPDFRSTPAECFACHADDYTNPNVHPNHVEAGFSTQCQDCHRTIGWQPAAFMSAAAALTSHRRFPLTGAHARAECLSCHTMSATPPSECAACHQGARQSAAQPRHTASGFADCDRCHTIQTWRPASRLQHERLFPLSGRHKGLDCRDCHIDPARLSLFTCAAGCHSLDKMRLIHQRTAGYSPDNLSCRKCHPLGRR